MRETDILVIGSGMGGMTAACLLAKEGMRVTVLEAAHLPGGCSSSYKKRGGVFETGATTLMGFDPGQPLHHLQKELGIDLPITPIVPSMAIDLGGRTLIRHQDLDRWIAECVREFGQPDEQARFWRLAKRIADTVWRVSLRNQHFPPTSLADWGMLLRNDPSDAWILPFAMTTVRRQCIDMGLTHPEFLKLVDEQLLISSQSRSDETSMLFGAPALTYTNYTNGYVEGGLLEMIRTLQRYLEARGGEMAVRRKVMSLERETDGWRRKDARFILRTDKGESWRAPLVVSNIPVWNLPELSTGEMRTWFQRQASRYHRAWGALTFGALVTDTFPDDVPLHRQIHMQAGDDVPGAESGSLFVSMSMKGDERRAPAGHRTLNISLHADPEHWFGLQEAYDRGKSAACEAVLRLLGRRFPGFAESELKEFFPATPVTWQRWVHRHRGRVGGIPQTIDRSLLDWPPAETPFKGLYLCGDTVYPGQGIPGVTLSGINVYSRIMRALKRRPITGDIP